VTGGGREGGRGLPHPAEEGEDAAVLLQDPGHGELHFAAGPEGVEERLAPDEALPLHGPHVDLLLAVGERAVARVQTLLPHRHLWRTQR